MNLVYFIIDFKIYFFQRCCYITSLIYFWNFSCKMVFRAHLVNFEENQTLVSLNFILFLKFCFYYYNYY